MSVKCKTCHDALIQMADEPGLHDPMPPFNEPCPECGYMLLLIAPQVRAVINNVLASLSVAAPGESA